MPPRSPGKPRAEQGKGVRFHVHRDREVPIRTQLRRQIVLAIGSGELAVGARLPSVRGLASELGVHVNTVSGVYRELARLGWVESRSGSGVFVRAAEQQQATPGAGGALARLLARFLRQARDAGFTLAEVKAELGSWLERARPPERFLVLERDRDLGALLAHEIAAGTGLPAAPIGLEAARHPAALAGAIPVALQARAAEVSALLPAGADCVWLKVRSVAAELSPHLAALAASRRLIAVAAGAELFLEWARTVLTAAGVSDDALVLADAREDGFAERLEMASVVITDALVATRLPARMQGRVRVFQLLDDATLDQLLQVARQLEATAPAAGRLPGKVAAPRR